MSLSVRSEEGLLPHADVPPAATSPTGGSYRGPDPRGLFETLAPAHPPANGITGISLFVPPPQGLRIVVFPGHRRNIRTSLTWHIGVTGALVIR